MQICKAAPVIFLAMFVAAAGCADLKGVNKFSVSGARLTAQPFPYSYSAFSFDSCYIYDTAKTVGHYPCVNSIATRYDTAVAREAGKLSAYFTALARLSGSAEVINVDTIAGAVVAGTYGKLTISSTEASVASGVATAIQDLATVRFKTKHLGANLHQYGSAVDSSLGSYIKHLQALKGQTVNLLIDLNGMLVYYRSQLPPGYSRFTVGYAYNEKIRDLTDKQLQFEKLITQLDSVRSGYRVLVAAADDVRSKSLKTQLLSVVNNISYINK
jgi:hypothetical protein